MKLKAREIKKNLENKLKCRIRHYEEVQKEHYANLRIELFQIKQIERLLNEFFGVVHNYLPYERESEM